MMARLRMVLLFVLILFPVPSWAEDGGNADIFAANKKLGRGVNLGNALDAPKEGEWGVTLKADYFKAIKEARFDSVRLPVRWSAHADQNAPYTIDGRFAERVDWAIDQALANRLNIIVNVHHYEEMDKNPDAQLPRLVALWEQIAARCKDRPSTVYFELFNEPHERFTNEKWNAAIPKLLSAVRKTNPNRPVIVGPTSWNAIRALDGLQLPKDDHNLILTIHYYDPFQFTHQGAPWIKESQPWKGKKWSGSEAERAEINKAFTKAANWAKEHNVPVFLGEFGAYQEAEMESRARWTAHIAREAERFGFSWSYWEFCSGFGVYDPASNSWRGPLKSALVP